MTEQLDLAVVAGEARCDGCVDRFREQATVEVRVPERAALGERHAQRRGVVDPRVDEHDRTSVVVGDRLGQRDEPRLERLTVGRDLHRELPRPKTVANDLGAAGARRPAVHEHTKPARGDRGRLDLDEAFSGPTAKARDWRRAARLGRVGDHARLRERERAGRERACERTGDEPARMPLETRLVAGAHAFLWNSITRTVHAVTHRAPDGVHRGGRRFRLGRSAAACNARAR